MDSPLLVGDHYILRKLCNELLPWMIAGRRVRRQWFVLLAMIYAYGGEAATALTGLGLGAPLVALFQGKAENGASALDILRTALPGIWFWVGIVALVLWLAVRLIVSHEDALARALFARDCATTMQRLYADLWVALGDSNPLPKLAPIQDAVLRKVREAIEKKVWPWDPPPPPQQVVGVELRTQINDIRMKFMREWEPPPPGVV
ncbi:MAG TPA: hypothetical protein VEI03_17300 [Stellaceae bacterium]|nr:hypothetical protein [Stellaceae bacterium]